MRNDMYKKILIMLFSMLAISFVSSFATAQFEGEEADAATLFGMTIVVIVMCFVIMLVLSILIGVWVYRDANSRGMSGGLWLALLIIATLVGSLIGFIVILVIYFIIRTDRPAYPVGAYPPPPGYGYPPPPPPPPGYP